MKACGDDQRPLLHLPHALFREETGDPSVGGLVARDSAGIFNGTYGVASLNGFNGIARLREPPPMAWFGFPDGNTALGFDWHRREFSGATLPAFNLNNGVGTNVLTITAWIHPAVGLMPSDVVWSQLFAAEWQLKLASGTGLFSRYGVGTLGCSNCRNTDLE